MDGVRVVKVGGAVVVDAARRAQLASRLAAAGVPFVLVHGGGPMIDAWSERVGLPVEHRDGLRVTTPEGLEVAEMVLAGGVNTSLVSALLDAGVEAVGLSGVDGSMIVAELAADGRLGRVGRVREVRTEVLRALLATGRTPVVAPISRDGAGGGRLNVNADEAAVAVAAALDACELLFITDVSAVHDGAGARPSLSAQEARRLVAGGVARDGMAVKLDAACDALAAGVRAVRIGPVGMLADGVAGTRVQTSGRVVA